MSDISEKQKQADLRMKSDEVIKKLPECSKMFFRSMRTSGKSERSIYQYGFDIKNFFDYVQNSCAFKDVKLNSLKISDILDKLTKEDLQEYIESISTYEIEEVDFKGNKTTKKIVSSPAYISRKVSSLKALYKYFNECGDIKTNPASLIKNPKLKNKNILIMENNEIERFMNAIESIEGMSGRQLKFHNAQVKRDKAMCMLFLGTGIRISELVGIDLSDIDFNEASIKIVRKGGDQDEVYFNNEVESALKDYIETERKNLLGECKCDALFVSLQKKRITPRNVETLIKGYTEKAGLNKKITPHSLRKTYGSYLYEQTQDIYLVAEALHHKSVDTTIRHYAKMSKERKREAAKISRGLIS